MLDALLASEQLPEEYRNREQVIFQSWYFLSNIYFKSSEVLIYDCLMQEILCHDCELKSSAPFHWLYHKCKSCGSYNTRALWGLRWILVWNFTLTPDDSFQITETWMWNLVLPFSFIIDAEIQVKIGICLYILIRLNNMWSG